MAFYRAVVASLLVHETTHKFNCNDYMRNARRSLRSLSRHMFDCKSYPFVLSFATLTRTKLRWSQLRLNGSVFYASQTLRFLRRFVAYWRKRSIPTHLERHNPPTIIAKMGLKRA